MAIHSTHKVLAAMTQASMLHLGGGSLVSAERVSRALELLQVTKGDVRSQPEEFLWHPQSRSSHMHPPGARALLAVLVAVVRAHGLAGRRTRPGGGRRGVLRRTAPRGSGESCVWRERERRPPTPPLHLRLPPHTLCVPCRVQVVRQGLASISGISLVQYDDDGDGHGAAHASDPLRFTVCVKGLGLTGYDAADILDEQHGVVSELSNHQVRGGLRRPVGALLKQRKSCDCAACAGCAGGGFCAGARQHAAPRRAAGPGVPGPVRAPRTGAAARRPGAESGTTAPQSSTAAPAAAAAPHPSGCLLRAHGKVGVQAARARRRRARAPQLSTAAAASLLPLLAAGSRLIKQWGE